MSYTTDKNDPRLNQVKDNGQNKAYLIMTDEELSKGYVRPFRDTYIHKGRKYENAPVLLSENHTFQDRVYIATIPVLKDEDGKVIGSSYLTKKEYDQWYETGGFIGGCGGKTTMARKIAETYAVNPKYYGATFCAFCGQHLSVNEFVWDGTDELVGS